MAAKIPERIENEEQYLELSMRMVKGAEIIDHPLTTLEKRAELMAVYDQMDEITQKWLRGGAAAFDTLPEMLETPSMQLEPEKSADEPTEGRPIDISAWLD